MCVFTFLQVNKEGSSIAIILRLCYHPNECGNTDCMYCDKSTGLVQFSIFYHLFSFFLSSSVYFCLFFFHSSPLNSYFTRDLG